MSTITKRQTYWRDHVLAAAAFDGTIVEYATLHNLKTKDIYQWKTALSKLRFLSSAERKVEADFVAVNSVTQLDTIQPAGTYSVQCRLTLPCGSVLEYFTTVEPDYLSQLLLSVRSR